MSLTSYRAAPPRVTTSCERFASSASMPPGLAQWGASLFSRRDMRLSTRGCVDVRRGQGRPRKTPVVAAPPL